MKRTLNLLLLTLLCLFAYSQENNSVPLNEIVIGENPITKESIYALEYTFPERVEDITVNPDKQIMLVQLRGVDKKDRLKKKGNLVIYDYANKAVKWGKPINFEKEGYSYFYDKLLKYTNGGTTQVNLDDGKDLWKIKASLFYVHPSGQVGIGTRGNSNNLEGFNMQNGKSIWKRKMKNPHDWNTMNLTDTTLLVHGSGLSSLNIVHGNGWEYEISTHSNNYTSVVVSGLLGVASAILTGYGSVRTNPDVTFGINSNVLIEDEERLYYAGRENFICLDFHGNALWNITLPKDMTSRSSIFIDEDTIYLINYGFAFFNGKLDKCGKPFIASYNKHTGVQNFATSIDETSYFNDYAVNLENNTLYLLYDNALALYALDEGTFTMKRNFLAGDNLPPLASVAGERLFAKDNEGYVNHVTTWAGNDLYVCTYDNDIYKIDSEFNVSKAYESNQLYTLYYENDGYRFLGNPTETVIIDNNDSTVAYLQLSNEANVVGDKLYGVKDNQLLEVNISSYMQ